MKKRTKAQRRALAAECRRYLDTGSCYIEIAEYAGVFTSDELARFTADYQGSTADQTAAEDWLHIELDMLEQS